MKYYYATHKLFSKLESNILTKDNDSVSSGGLYYLFSKYILDNNGVCYGVSFKNNDIFSCEYTRATTTESLKKHFGSKYIQVDYSNIDSIIQNVEKDLNNNRFVLFSGKPCDIIRLSQKIDFSKYENLYTLDLICSGYTSNIDYIKNYSNNLIDFYKNNYNLTLELVKLIFRPDFCFVFKIVENDNKLIIKHPFYKMLNIFNIKTCKIKNCIKNGHISDITIGDYRPTSISFPFRFKSTLVVNTSKGLNLLNRCSSNCILREFDETEKIELIKAHNYLIK